jgi:hypothetical protein
MSWKVFSEQSAAMPIGLRDGGAIPSTITINVVVNVAAFVTASASLGTAD